MKSKILLPLPAYVILNKGEYVDGLSYEEVVESRVNFILCEEFEHWFSDPKNKELFKKAYEQMPYNVEWDKIPLYFLVDNESGAYCFSYPEYGGTYDEVFCIEEDLYALKETIDYWENSPFFDKNKNHLEKVDLDILEESTFADF